MTPRILVVDDEKLIRWSLGECFRKEGFQVELAGDGAAAAAFLEKHDVDLALLDLRLPDTDGIQLLKKAHDEIPGLPVIIITAFSSIDSAVEAMRCGAVDYITKPFNMDELMISVRRVLDTESIRQRLSSHINEEKVRFGLGNIVGESPKMIDIRRLVRRIARSETTSILLLGESGTGKDMIARAIHYESARADKPFMNITSTALPETLLESQIFGHEKGAFTDARELKKGLFEFADGGSVYLDEIGDMQPALQAKLLRVLEDRAFKRVGGTDDIRVDVRVIAATNRNIHEAMKTGQFREDLFYRLSAVPIVVPPLRERKEDLPALANHFLQLYNHEFHRDISPLSTEVVEKLSTYNWPGNVRELRNVIERAALLAKEDTLMESDVMLGTALLGHIQPAVACFRLPEEGCNMEEVEKMLLQQALERTQGNRTRAAELLGMTRDQIRYKMEKFDLNV
ncbi:MAG TPA: sigma-54 dependent transcriptional regulator [Candidatus Hydrogenedentes bacterium]|nr:sigma-54 dependent transcriptional regulator [Candidatus Hydrogenedentota bacterium]